MKRLYAVLILVTGTVGLLLTAPAAQAVPAFARQMGVACNTCHFQHFPELNSFGRAFKASGFTMTGTSLIESDNFSLPANLNAAIFTNLRWQRSNGDTIPGGPRTSNNGELILPSETSLFVGGRVSPHVGALVEGDVGAAGAAPGNGFLASIKVPFVFPVTSGINLGIVPFSSGLGPAYAFETMNTGAVGNHFMNLVHTTSMSASQYIQIAYSQEEIDDNPAEGIGLYMANSDFFVTLAKWSPNHDIVDAFGASAAPNSDYARIALTPTFAGWDMGIGGQWFGGSSNEVGQNGSTVDLTACSGGSIPQTACPINSGSTVYTKYQTKAWIVDAQMQGEIFALPTGVYLSYGQAPSSKAGKPQNIYNPYSKTKKAASVAAEMGIWADGRVTLQAAYRWAKTGNATYSDDRASTVGLTYLPWNNVQLAVYQTWYNGSAHSTAALNSGDQYGLGGLIDASGTGDSLTSMNVAVGF